MLIISTENTNTNTNTLFIEIETPTEFINILEREDVKDFFGEAGIETILENVAAVNGIDAANLGNIRNLIVDFDNEIEILMFGETEEQNEQAEEQSATTATAGAVTVTTGGGISSKEVPVVNGVTRVGDIITPTLASFFALTPDTMHAMKIEVNDVEATATTVLRNGDSVAFMTRKAGDKGSMSIIVKCADTVFVKSTEGCVTLEDFVESLDIEFEFTLDKVNDAAVPEALYDIIMKTPVEEITSITLINDDFDEIDEEEEELSELDGDEGQEDEEQEDEDKEFVEGTPGMATIYGPGGFYDKKIAILHGVTKLGEAVVSPSVLNFLAMTADQAQSLKYKINDVDVELGDTIENGDVITMEARKAGDKGC